MTIHFFTKGDAKLPDSQQRAFGIARELEARGVATTIHTPPVMLISETRWPKKALLIFSILRALTTVKKGDIIFLQRAISNKYFFVIMWAYLTLFRRKMVFDYDDAIYMHDFYKTKKFTQIASAVFAGSNVLAKWARQYNSNVHVIHTSLKFAAYEAHTKDYSQSGDVAVVGWVGTARNHYANLSLLAEVFKILLARSCAPFKFRLIGVWKYPRIKELFEHIEGLDVEFVEYVETSKLPETIQTFDIGVMPLVGTGEWNQARSSFKPIEYMSCGIAAISSNIGAITDIVVNGQNGFLAESAEDWANKLELLINDKALCAKLGAAGQESIRSTYGYEAIVPKMIQIFKSL